MTPPVAKSTGELHEAIKTLTAFVWSIHLQRVLLGVDPKPRLNFWRAICNNFFDMAVIEWSKLFGYDRKQPMQWRSAVPEAEHAAFSVTSLGRLGSPASSGMTTRMKLKRIATSVRRTIASSLDPDLPRDFPWFDVALKAAHFYYDWILNRMQDRGEAHHYPPDLDDYCRRFSEQARKAAQRAIAATATVDEQVK
jgi:hypothetical protein